MKRNASNLKSRTNNNLTFGDLVVAVYNASTKRKARALLRFAVNAHLIGFPGSSPVLIS